MRQGHLDPNARHALLGDDMTSKDKFADVAAFLFFLSIMLFCMLFDAPLA